MPAAAQVGDDLGSRLILGRLATTTVHLAYVVSGEWMPYSKWVGTLLARIPGTADLASAREAALRAATAHERTDRFVDALEALLGLQRAAGLPASGPATEPFWDRPFRHPRAEIAEGLLSDIRDPEIAALPRGRGCVEQRTDNVALLVDPAARRALVVV
jgi:hypothetical protein